MQATLINPNTGDKKTVEAGSQDAQQLFGQGYQLMGSSGQAVAPTTPSTPTGQSPTGGNMVDPNQAAQDAELWQYLQGGDLGENPYIAFLQPYEIEKDGKKYLRIPKNQELKDMAIFWEDWRSGRIEHRENFMDDYLKYRHDMSTEAVDEGGLALDMAKFEQAIKENDFDEALRMLEEERLRIETNYKVNKPYYKPGGDGFEDKQLTFNEAIKAGVPYGTMRSEVEGQTFGQETKNFENFVKEAHLDTGISQLDPQQAYDSYLEAQQTIDFNPASFQGIVSDPDSAAFAHLLNPKQSSIEDQITQSVLENLGLF